MVKSVGEMMSVSEPSEMSKTIAQEIFNRCLDKSPSGNKLKALLAEAAEEGYQEGLLEGRS